jgi:hypothetical protein
LQPGVLAEEEEEKESGQSKEKSQKAMSQWRPMVAEKW